METITYLVANYNNARYVEDCLVSLKNQTCDRWRCIVCDDHSTDDSVVIIKRHPDSRIRLLENSKNVGYIGTLKRMIAAAPSDIVGILDSDDALEKDATAHVLQAYADDKNTSFVFTRFAYMDENLRCQLGVSGVPGSRAGGHSELLLTCGNVSALRSFRKSLYYRTEGLDESMLYAEDRDLIYKLEEKTRPVFIDEVLYKWRVIGDSQSNDPVKNRIGRHNHRRARKNSLCRRQIRGAQYFLLRAYLRLIAHSPTSPKGERWPKRLCRTVIRAAQNGLARRITPLGTHAAADQATTGKMPAGCGDAKHAPRRL